LEKKRLDILLVQKGLADSREKAKSTIMAGLVTVNGLRADKPGSIYSEDADIKLKENYNPYVSRGGLKLDKAIKYFGINLAGKKAVDVGASTGGFTDCMLKNGADFVVCIDVGYGQLAWSLRNDPRVKNLERTNIRYVKPSDVDMVADFATIDVSFISLSKVLPPVKDLLDQEKGEVLCLIKPQFEAGREKVGKHGVVRNIEVHKEVVEEVVKFSLNIGFKLKGLTYSPIKGPEGNIEYLCYLSLAEGTDDAMDISKTINTVVEQSHEELN